jgi:hypothetical protein
MKEKIYMIPVNDAFNTPCECPLCELEAKTTDDLLTYFMGASVMEPDIRIMTNKKGFCKEHLTALYNRQENRLGLGLMLHTHMTELCGKTKKLLSKAEHSARSRKIFALKSDYAEQLKQVAQQIENQVTDCALCARLEYTLDRYVDVILWQFFEDEEFRAKFMQTKGFCLPHLALLLRGAAKYLSKGEAKEFIAKMSSIENESLEVLKEELLWFTRKYDYKNEDKPWGNSKDAIPRTIRKTIGQMK